MKIGKPKIKDPISEAGVLFFKVPLIFQTYMSSLTQSEKDIYIYFMIQMKYKKSRWLELSYEHFMNTGIKSKDTISIAIFGLVTKGWISDIQYQKNKPNKYLINLEPVENPLEKNKELIEKIILRSKNTSEAKKKSIANGEGGKFEKKELDTPSNP